MPTSTRFLVDPSERLIDEACPVCGGRLLEFDIPFMGRSFAAVDCPACMRRREAEEKAERDARAEAKVRLRAAGVPATLAGVKPDASWLPHIAAGGSLWIVGDNATARACSMAAAWTKGSIRYTTDYEVYHMSSDAVEGCYGTGLLLIDGVGKSNPGVWGGSRLGAILDVRQKAGRPTIVASIMSPSEAVGNIAVNDPAAARGIESVLRGWKGVKA